MEIPESDQFFDLVQSIFYVHSKIAGKIRTVTRRKNQFQPSVLRGAHGVQPRHVDRDISLTYFMELHFCHARAGKAWGNQ